MSVVVQIPLARSQHVLCSGNISILCGIASQSSVRRGRDCSHSFGEIANSAQHIPCKCFSAITCHAEQRFGVAPVVVQIPLARFEIFLAAAVFQSLVEVPPRAAHRDRGYSNSFGAIANSARRILCQCVLSRCAPVEDAPDFSRWPRTPELRLAIQRVFFAATLLFPFLVDLSFRGERCVRGCSNFFGEIATCSL